MLSVWRGILSGLPLSVHRLTGEGRLSRVVPVYHVSQSVASVEKDYPAYHPMGKTPDHVWWYNILASELLSMRCGECHGTSSQLVAYDPDVSCEFLLSTSRPEATAEEISYLHRAFRAHMALFCAGDMSIDDFYQAVVHEHFPVLQVNDDDAAWDVFSAVLKSIEEPERRSNLQLRYYRDRPCVRTVCCNAEHCYQCAMYGFHHGKSCMEERDDLDNTIVQCPTCNISLVKGDGCDSVNCVCGSNFDWASQLSALAACDEFLELYPVQPSAACARILCEKSTSENDHQYEIQLANAWRERHPIDVSRALVDWFRARFSPFVSQACATLVDAEQTEGVVLAMGLWRAEHAAEVAHYKAQSDLAVASLFLTMQRRAADRAMAARRFITSAARDLSVNRLMRRSVNMWIEAHREEYDRGVVEWQQRSAQQLLFRFGSLPLVYMKPLEKRIGQSFTKIHFDSLFSGLENSVLSTIVPFNTGNSSRWTKLVAELDQLIASLDDGFATAVPKSVLVTDGSRWLAHCSSSVCIARERAQDMLAAMREFLRIRRFETRVDTVSLEPLRSTPLVLVLEALSWLFHDRARPPIVDWAGKDDVSSSEGLFDVSHQQMQLCA